MNTENTWRESLEATPECPPLPELLDNPAALTGHVAGCARCQTELALFAAMEQAPDPGAVGAISKRLKSVDWAEAGRTGVVEPRVSFWQRLLSPRFLAPASLALASALMLVTVVQVNRPGTVKGDLRTAEQGLDQQQLRSQQIRGLAPLGTVATAPHEFRWEPVTGASEYQVSLMEVDREAVWQTRVSSGTAAAPASVAGKMLPGKRLLWEVTAFGSDGKRLASSGTLEFTTSLH